MIAKLEQRTCKPMRLPYLDDLEEMYNHEIDTFLADVVIKIESSIVLKNVMELFRIANYRPNEEVFHKAISAYMIALDDQL